MGEEILITNIEIVNGTMCQIDIWYTQQKKGDRIFIEREVLLYWVNIATINFEKLLA